MSPVNNDPSNGTGGGGMPLTRKELRARERFLATQNQNVVPVPEATPGESGASPEVEQELPRPVPAVPNAAAAQRPYVAPPAAQPAPAPDEPAPRTAEPGSRPAGQVPSEDGSKPVPPAPEAAPSISEVPAPAATPPQDAADAGRAATEAPDATTHFPVVAPVYAGHAEDDRVHGDQAADYGHHDYSGHDLHHTGELHPDHDEHYVYDEQHDGHPDEHHLDGHAHDLIPAMETPVSKAAARKARRRRRVVALLITLGVFVAAIVIGAQFLKPLLGMDKVTDYPGPGSGSVTVTVPEGAGPKQVATDLVSKKVVADADSFVKAFVAEGGVLAPGDFTFKTEMKNSDAVAILSNKDSSKVIYFALSAGLRINESLDAISKGSGIPLQQLNAFNQAPGQFGLPAKAKNLEGFLAPGEYRFPLGTSGKDIIQALVTATLDELKAQGITDQAKQYDVVTIASIVQAEGGQADYGNVAGAIYNRLKPDNKETNGLIQSDATVTYGLGKKSFHLTDEEKADKSNTYNTYANVGLPAGPIGSPGKTAIDAAAKPTSNDYLYWVTINLDTKETKFSKTLSEHSGYVEQYNAWCAANPGRCV
ncbi:endolytic transglycosylase MltG [Paenarthrobacter sp. NPDC058040]|uniref:endolytic transglycosylase MltG n=1 Tax=unclassified Paenarthrobacter TaxID=2634190 RepID=UPI0036D78DA7